MNTSTALAYITVAFTILMFVAVKGLPLCLYELANFLEWVAYNFCRGLRTAAAHAEKNDARSIRAAKYRLLDMYTKEK